MESRIAANYNDATQLGRVARGQYGAHGRLHIVALEIQVVMWATLGLRHRATEIVASSVMTK